MAEEKEKIHKMVKIAQNNITGFYDMMKKMKKNPKEITNVLLLSSKRSGGNFLGQLLTESFPDTFYALNPLFLASFYHVSTIYF